ncbi:hypothetical protein P691DRAFT_812502 [Macrolepiota fuliginosa MF-IS2]|uniref:Uncharacterized protein n=1 Tax=Macrolepiota fuliginosa MF-IS2 TaxID=1400762 RepID=A0A9P5XNL8_9AGAR|nr:hypothetical protein P691DRAFT_812502 [Macrolepiota fuliginosa MF-IS2]
MLLACFLFGLIVFSYKHPGRLQEYVGAKVPKQSAVADAAVYTPPLIPSPEAPLHPSEYVAQCRELNQGFMTHGDYWDRPSMDMGSSQGLEDEEAVDDTYRLPEGGRTAVCSKTITYLLDGEVGLLADLALIAQAAALARERNRTLIIDDTYWNRGKWGDHFEDAFALQPGPEPGCRAPHPKNLVACPRTARHWVITAHTAKYHFGHPFSDHYEDPYARNLNRLRPIYDAAHKSFISTIRPNSELGALIRSARHEFKESISTLNSTPETYMSVHIRRGDRKQRLSNSKPPYISISEFATAIQLTQSRLDDVLSSSMIYFASDSPSAESEFATAFSERFFSLRQSQDPALWQLASMQDYDQKTFNALSKEERIRLTKGMVVDFALLSGVWAWKGDPVPQASVCTISSNICKMMAVGLGWDKAFGRVDEMGYLDDHHKGWVEIEQKGQIIPLWSAFELS